MSQIGQYLCVVTFLSFLVPFVAPSVFGELTEENMQKHLND
jgi:hypothetical protein